ncbi:MAG: hypothetical protein IJU54_01670 [Alphaproteobacteria bacterium]|nr:hypothetical protein [Alphaproteobacteria bacterium]
MFVRMLYSKLFKLILSSATVIYSLISFANASGMIFDLEPGNFKFTYVRGYACRSQTFNNMNELARNIRNISSSNMSASSGISSGETVVLNGLKIALDDFMDQVVFSSKHGYSVVMQCDSDMYVTKMRCNNIPLFRVHGNKGTHIVIDEFDTDVMTVIEKNNCGLCIDGIEVGNCRLAAYPGVNNIKPIK